MRSKHSSSAVVEQFKHYLCYDLKKDLAHTREEHRKLYLRTRLEHIDKMIVNSVTRCTQQENDKDCGVYSLQYLEEILLKLSGLGGAKKKKEKEPLTDLVSVCQFPSKIIMVLHKVFICVHPINLLIIFFFRVSV
jgi:hypothetical protein